MAYKENNSNIKENYVDKSYLIDVYPQLSDKIKSPGLWLWGQGAFGALGNNSATNKSSPVQTITGGSNWKSISNGNYFSAAIKTDGTLWMWGSNADGELGDNSTTTKSSPVQTVAGGTNWRQVSLGGIFSKTAVAIKTDGTLWVWGDNTKEKVGGPLSRVSSPVQTVAGGTNWKYVSNGTNHIAAIKTDSTLWLWGADNLGQQGTNSTETSTRSSPVQTVAGGTDWKSVSAGFDSTAAIKTDGTLWLWGINDYGQLGTNDRTNRSSPVQTVAGGTDWKQVSSIYKGIAAIKTDGTLWLWGNNLYGQLGTNDLTPRSSPVQTVAGGANWKLIGCGGGGYSFSCGTIKTDGTLWLWGKNDTGQLGNNNFFDVQSPVQTVAGGTNWKYVECSIGFSMAIKDFNEDF